MMFILGGCEDTKIEDQKDPEVFFEVSYANTAWGRQFKGLIIDNEGKIKTYDNPPKWNKALDKNGLTQEQLDENLASSSISSITLSEADFHNYASKVAILSDTAYTKPAIGGVDRGITSFYAYRFDATKMTYKPILLSETGDLEKHNKDKNAKEISEWLTKVLDDVY